MLHQKTLKSAIYMSGEGLHTGQHASIEIHPAPVDFGLVFRLVSEDHSVDIPVLVENVVDTTRCTTIGREGYTLKTVEHLLSALAGYSITNARIDVRGNEIPIFDGSSHSYCREIERVGIQVQDKEQVVFYSDEVITYTAEDGGEISYIPGNESIFEATVDFGNNNGLETHAEYFMSKGTYLEDISKSKTFVFFKDLEYLLDHGLSQGGNISNALIVSTSEVAEDAIQSIYDRLKLPHEPVDTIGILNKQSQTYTNELARHKILDLMGDLSFLGIPIKGTIKAFKPGHTINKHFVHLLQQKLKEDYK